MEIQYLVGLDIGHGETAASICEISTGKISAASIKVDDAAIEEKKVISAICQTEDGKSKLVLGGPDYSKPHLMQGFKGIINDLTDERREAFYAFIRLTFDKIQANNGLKFDRVTGEKNFLLYIACPSGWDNKAANDYYNTIKNIIPVDYMLKESDAAYYRFRDKVQLQDKKVLVIDYGSSTIDFTLYDGKTKISWTDPVPCPFGASRVEQIIYQNYCKQDKFKERYRLLQHINNALNNKVNISEALLLAIRASKERFYSMMNTYPEDEYIKWMCDCPVDMFCPQLMKSQFDVLKKYGLDKEAQQLFEDGTPLSLIKFALSQNQVDELLNGYKEDIKKEFLRVKQTLPYQPEAVIVTGGASRMPFIGRMLRDQIFVRDEGRKDEIMRDKNQPEYVVSDGLVQYAQTLYKVEEEIKQINKDFDNWADLELESTMKTSLSKVVKECDIKELKKVCEDYKTNGSSYQDLINAVVRHNEEVVKRNETRINDRVNVTLREELNKKLWFQIDKAVYKAFEVHIDKNVDILPNTYKIGGLRDGYDSSFDVDAINYAVDIIQAGKFFGKWGGIDMYKQRSPSDKDTLATKYLDTLNAVTYNCPKDDFTADIVNLKNCVYDSIRQIVYDHYTFKPVGISRKTSTTSSFTTASSSIGTDKFARNNVFSMTIERVIPLMTHSIVSGTIKLGRVDVDDTLILNYTNKIEVHVTNMFNYSKDGLSYGEVGQNVGLVIDCKSDLVEPGMVIHSAV